MTNFIKIMFLATALVSVATGGFALIRVRAQVAAVQPFVAIMIEEAAPRPDQPPTPITRFQTIAVRSDGSVSKVTKWDVRPPTKTIYWRDVIDATTKTHAEVEDTTRTIITQEYSDLQLPKPGVSCGGSPAGQMESLDVMYSEQQIETTDPATSVTYKRWLAPRLGCYPIKQEWVGKIQGAPMDTTQTLANIELRVPEPWYFNIPANYTTRTTDDWMELAKPFLKQ